MTSTSPDEPRSRLLARAGLVAGALVASVATLAATRSIGTLVEHTLRQRGLGALLAPLLALFVYFLAALVCWFLYARRKALPGDQALVAAVAALFLGGGYALHLRVHPPQHRLGAVITPPSLESFVENYGHRPHVTYRFNAQGFREPAWDKQKAPGVTRVVTIGDSYVFGAGVEAPDTLAASIEALLARRHPGRAFEVVNLGLDGNNLHSHVDLYEAAQAELDPDIVVLCLTLPNDLSDWDDAIARREQYEPGWFSLALHVFGPAAYVVWDEALLVRDETDADPALLDTDIARLTRARAQSSRIPLMVFEYRHSDLTSLFGAIPGAFVLPPPEDRPEFFIPLDGHPTPAGNRRFAEIIVEAMEKTPRLGQAPLEQAPLEQAPEKR